MKIILFVLLLFVGCSSTPIKQSNSTYASITISNETDNMISFEIKSSENGKEIKTPLIDLSSKERKVIVVKFLEGWNYIIAHQDGKKSERTFLIKNSSMVVSSKNLKSLTEAIFYTTDFK